MIRVCDAIMGTGKSMSAINYMNNRPDDKFIYITPYLEEAKRIKESCPELKFVEPSNKLPEYHYSKTEHTKALIKNGRNVATTHQAFKYYTKETLDKIKEKGYTLFIDENVEVLESFGQSVEDLKIMVSEGYIKEENGIYSLAEDKVYKGKAFSDVTKLLKSRNLVRVDFSAKSELFFWTLPKELLTSFKDVFILTYLFESQSLYYFITLNNLEYERIGISRTDGGYCFCEYPGYMPEYVYNLKSMIRILQNDRMNNIGKKKFSLSMGWFTKDSSDIKKLKDNVYNFFNNICGDVPSNNRVWSTYSWCFGKIKGKGYTKRFLSFNTRATNEFRNCTALAYVTNIYMNVSEKLFFRKLGIEVDEDMYALSTMIQWIWRSAIRDGDPVDIYVPSKRMRTLLEDWIESVSKGVPVQ